MLEAEGATPSIVRDHAFEPRRFFVFVGPLPAHGDIERRILQANPYLCATCRLAEAAHEETTVER